MTCVRKDKAWEIVVYKNQYYVELYGCAIRVYDKSFELVYQRDNPKDFYSQIIIVEDTLFAQGQCNPFIDVFELPQLKLKKRIKWNGERDYERNEHVNMLYRKSEGNVYASLYSQKKDVSIITAINIKENYLERVIWKAENVFLEQMLYSEKRNDYALLYRKIYENKDEEIFTNKIVWAKKKEKILEIEVEKSGDIESFGIDLSGEIWCWIEPVYKSGYILQIENNKKIAKVKELVTFSREGFAFSKKGKIYLYSYGESVCKKVIEMDKECEGLYRIQFIGKEYIAVRGCRYMYWYKI